jgi:hypothetical protein
MSRTGSYFSSSSLRALSCSGPVVAVAVVIAGAEEGGGGAGRRIDRELQVAGEARGVVCGGGVAFPA